MVEVLISAVLVVGVSVFGYLLYRRHNREPVNPTIARESELRQPGTGLFGDQSGFWP